MPSDVRKEAGTPGQAAVMDAPSGAPGTSPTPPIEPPSMKLLVRLFLIPLLIAGAVIAVMVPIGWMAEGPMSKEKALGTLKLPGGEKTLGMVGPASKQRYMAAKALVDHMKAGMTEPERIALAKELTEILETHTKADEGDVQHFVLLALGRAWQKYPGEEPMNSAEAVASREAVLKTLTKYFDAPSVEARKAAILALAFWQGQPESRAAIPALVQKLSDPKEDLDVRIAVIATLGNVAQASDPDVVTALNNAMRETEPRNAELSWNAALSLAEFNRPEAKDTLMMLLRREDLAKLQVYDRETDPRNPVFRSLNDEEQQRFLMNAMERARNLRVDEVQAQLKTIAETDPSQRVRASAVEILAKKQNG